MMAIEPLVCMPCSDPVEWPHSYEEKAMNDEFFNTFTPTEYGVEDDDDVDSDVVAHADGLDITSDSYQERIQGDRYFTNNYGTTQAWRQLMEMYHVRLKFTADQPPIHNGASLVPMKHWGDYDSSESTDENMPDLEDFSSSSEDPPLLLVKHDRDDSDCSSDSDEGPPPLQSRVQSYDDNFSTDDGEQYNYLMGTTIDLDGGYVQAPLMVFENTPAIPADVQAEGQESSVASTSTTSVISNWEDDSTLADTPNEDEKAGQCWSCTKVGHGPLQAPLPPRQMPGDTQPGQRTEGQVRNQLAQDENFVSSLGPSWYSLDWWDYGGRSHPYYDFRLGPSVRDFAPEEGKCV